MFGWKGKVDRFKMILLSAGHQSAKELPPSVQRVLELFREAVATGNPKDASAEIDKLPPLAREDRMLHEPISIGGWDITASMYLSSKTHRLHWLVRGVRRNESTPTPKDIVFLEHVITRLGGNPVDDMIIGPRTVTADHPTEPLPFGWWSWLNQAPLYEVQCKGRGNKATVRVVPMGTPATDGWVRLDLSSSADAPTPEEA